MKTRFLEAANITILTQRRFSAAVGWQNENQSRVCCSMMRYLFTVTTYNTPAAMKHTLAQECDVEERRGHLSWFGGHQIAHPNS